MFATRFPTVVVLAGLIALVATDAFAAPDYRCIVQRVVMTSAQSVEVLKRAEQDYVGKQFTVERRTGLMAGILKNSYVTKPVVIDPGSVDNSYKVVTTMRREEGSGVGSNIYALTINEYEKSPLKGFIFLQNNVAYLGTCEHF